MLVELILIILLLLASAFFSGIEIAYISADRLRIELAKKKGTASGLIVAGFVERPSQFLGTTLVGNNIVLVIFSILAERFMLESMGLGQVIPNEIELIVLTLISTVVVLIFGEFLPKVIFRTTATASIFLFAYPFYIIKFILTPVVWVMVQSSYGLLRLFLGIRPKDNEQVFTKLDLEHFIKSTKTSSAQEIDHTLFQNALYISTVKVRDCMVPRNEIQCININSTIEELREKFIECQNSRIIVYDDGIDDIKGYVHHQKLLENPSTIDHILFKITVVHDFSPARDVMNRLIKEKRNIAWVVDEFGGTAGIVTLEDLLEQIFGDISDEYDPEELNEAVSENEYLFSGRLDIDFINEEYELGLPESDGYNTLSGFLVAELEAIPEQGSNLHWNNYEFVFEQVSDTRVEVVRVRRLFDSDEEIKENE